MRKTENRLLFPRKNNASPLGRESRQTDVCMDGTSRPGDIIHMKVLKRQWSDVIGMF